MFNLRVAYEAFTALDRPSVRSGGAERSAKGKGQKEKRQKGKLQTKNRSIKHKSLGIKSSFLGVSLTLCRLNIIGLEAKLKP